MYFYVIGFTIPMAIISYYLFQRYRKPIWNKCLEAFISIMVGVGTRIFTTKNNVQVEKRYVCIPYKYHGVDYKINVPFSRSLRRKMINSKVVLLKDGSPEELVQQPGCCFLVTASMLGGQSIKIINTDTGKETIFEGDDIPVF